MEDTGLHRVGAGEAVLFVDGEERFQRTMHDLPVFEQRHDEGHADAVVGAQRGAVGPHPALLDVGGDGVGLEIVDLARGLLRHHVHVCLEDDAGTVLHPGGGRLADQHVAHLIHRRLQPQVRPKPARNALTRSS